MIILSQFWPLLKWATFFEAAGAVVEISSSLRIMNCNQVKLAQILDTHCRNTPLVVVTVSSCCKCFIFRELINSLLLLVKRLFNMVWVYAYISFIKVENHCSLSFNALWHNWVWNSVPNCFNSFLSLSWRRIFLLTFCNSSWFQTKIRTDADAAVHGCEGGPGRGGPGVPFTSCQLWKVWKDWPGFWSRWSKMTLFQ